MARVLLIEDDPSNRALIEHVLRSMGKELLSLSTSDGVLEAIQQFKPDLIILDIGLPGTLSGFEVAHAVKASADMNNIPIIATTARKDIVGDAEFRAVSDAFLTKPFQLAQLREMVQNFLTPI